LKDIYHTPADTVEWLSPARLAEAIDLAQAIVQALAGHDPTWTRPTPPAARSGRAAAENTGGNDGPSLAAASPVTAETPGPAGAAPLVAIGSDHVGYPLKEALIAHLAGRRIPCRDFGPAGPARTHYPLFAGQITAAILAGEAELGILICGTGVGMAIAANKVRGIRAVVCSEPYTAAMSRRHNNSNVLCLGARVVGPGLAVDIVDAWLKSEFEGGRHVVRLDMIAQLEREPGQ
jgi:ribose 5-phosphate isomerase B